jgi:type IV pilus assembly protein PilY1
MLMNALHWIVRCVLLLAIVLVGPVRADDTDIYLTPTVAGGAAPLVMFSLDYRPNLTSTACGGSECDELIAQGYLPASGPYNFFMVLRAVLKKVLDPLTGVQVGLMLNHASNCSGSATSGPGAANCSNGGYILQGFTPMLAGSDDSETYQRDGEDAGKLAFFDKLDAIPDPQGNISHPYQGKEAYFELFRYLTGQGVYNGHLGFIDFGDTDKNTNLDVHHPELAWDRSIENAEGTTYNSALAASGQCSRAFVVNLMFQVTNHDEDSDSAIRAAKADGGMGGIDLSGKNNSFDTVIRYMKDADLGDGSYGSAGVLEGKQNVVSYFLVDPTKINKTTNGYASAGGTGVALPLSSDPRELIKTLRNLFNSILSVSTTFVAPSVPVNVFNRAQIVNEVFMALFEAQEDGFPLWDGNLKKLRIGDNTITGEPELQDVNGLNAIDIDGRIRRDALTFWTQPASLPAPGDDAVAGADGRAVARGGAGQRVPGFTSGTPGQDNTVLGGRRIYTENSGATALRDLDADAATAAALWSELTADWSPAAAATYADASAGEQARALNALRFARGLEDDGTTTRRWLLADPLHSRPRPVNYGARGGRVPENPDIRILMGTNDGALHMFRNTQTLGAEDGTESWAYLPRTLLRKLTRLRENVAGTPVHPLGLDGSVEILTLDLNQDGTLEAADGDKVIAYFGLRRGGKALYALDVSDPDAPQMLWQIDKGAPGTAFAELGQTWSTPVVGRLDVGAGVVPVLVFGGGYNGDDDGDDAGDLGKDARNRATRAGIAPSLGSDDDEGAAVFIVNALDGTLIWKATGGTTAGHDPASKRFVHTSMVDALAAPVAAIDSSGDGLLDRIYAADTGGVLWRMDLAGMVDHDGDPNTPPMLMHDDPSAWTAMRLLSVGRHAAGFASAEHDRRFFNTSDVAASRDGNGPFDAVIIGTGDREDPNASGVVDYFYMFKDRHVTSGVPPASGLEHGDLADLTSNCLQDSSCTKPAALVYGWRIALADSGEKALADAVTVAGQIFFTTFTPTASSDVCTLSEGTGRLYVVSVQDATAVMNFDSTNDIDSVTYERWDKLGSGGIPVKVVPLNESYVLVQGQEAGENIVKVNVQTGYKTYWYEVNH